MNPLITIAVFAAALAALARWLGRQEDEGNFDPQAPASAAQPGLRRFFDYSGSGWPRDGARQDV
ncbi:MAG: hypothetical protein EA388_16190 [Nitriliruptor sp.]|nr:MAG: hypothetical protein EA388_16190 [Nitriliruptor sp.]